SDNCSGRNGSVSWTPVYPKLKKDQGFVTFTEFFKEIALVHISFDVTESLDNSHKVEDPKHQCLQQFLDCSVEVLTEIHKVSNAEV
ncbi:serine/threonine protein kinase ATM, partial [Trifolium medium]|nr:serine/threonine protein kinase ATM [Trifolium medium]